MFISEFPLDPLCNIYSIADEVPIFIKLNITKRSIDVVGNAVLSSPGTKYVTPVMFQYLSYYYINAKPYEVGMGSKTLRYIDVRCHKSEVAIFSNIFKCVAFYQGDGYLLTDRFHFYKDNVFATLSTGKFKNLTTI